jgi:uncharacterized protein (UPF0332 family)
MSQFDWEEYLDLAEDLLPNGPGYDAEAEMRCAISRAYYAAFNIARIEVPDFLLSETGEDHRNVREYFEDQPGTVGRDLRRLHKRRKEADYDHDCGDLAQYKMRAKEAIRMGRTVIGEIDDE